MKRTTRTVTDNWKTDGDKHLLTHYDARRPEEKFAVFHYYFSVEELRELGEAIKEALKEGVSDEQD